VAALKIRCDCRKPKTGLIDQAVNALSISRRDSWMVGDTTSDVRAGRRAGLRTILVRTGHAGRDTKYDDAPDYVMPDLKAAVDWVLQGHVKASQILLPALPAALGARMILIGGPARAGKGSIAQVLAEQLANLGKTTHVLSLDGWLRPVDQRPEGTGVLERYAMDEAVEQLSALRAISTRIIFYAPVYDRDLRSSLIRRRMSIGPDDVLVVEGVPALLDARLIALSDLRLHIDVPDEVRLARVRTDYAWREAASEGIEQRLVQRETDEVPMVRASATQAHFKLQGL
jgi:uridine kinase